MMGFGGIGYGSAWLWMLAGVLAVAGIAVLVVWAIDPWAGRLETAAQASPVDAPSDELTAVIGDPIARVGTWALMALIATIIFIMVVKPLGLRSRVHDGDSRWSIQ